MLALLVAAIVYQATVVNAVDGDTLRVKVDGWPAPFTPIDVRVYGVDTPEHRMPPAQAACEVELGQRAADYAKSLIKPGDVVRVTWVGRREKWGRLLATVTLPDGRDWAQTMVAGGYARPYGQDGNLHKQPWC